MFYQPILLPLLAQIALTFLVWIYLYFTRLREIQLKNIDPQDLACRTQGQTLLTSSANPADNFKNLFEMPVIFYALCLYLFVTGNVDSTYMTSAWVFLVFRSIHSAIHCTVNIVRLRFLTYMIATFTLWFMMFRAVLDFYSTLPA